MKQVCYILTLFCFFSADVFAQNTDAQAILDKAAAKAQAAKGLSLSFSLTQKDKSNHIVSFSKGILKAKGEKYYIKQEGSEIFCNGIQVWNYDGENEVTIAKVDDDDEDVYSPQQIITGFDKKDYSSKLTSYAGTNYQVLLTPVDKRKNFKQVLLYINKSTSLITKAAITDKMNAVTEVSFNSILLNASFADSQFVFDAAKHPGVEVVNQ